MAATSSPNQLKRSLSAVHLWAMAVGLVISGDYFGWNYGWGEAGTVGFLFVTLFVAILYITFIFSFTELTTAIPNAGGPFTYAMKAFGPYGGVIAGYAALIEFVFAAPPVAFALGSYAHFLYEPLQVTPVALICFVVFTLLNMLGIKESASFSLFVTILALAELLVYIGVVAPHFSFDNFIHEAFPIHGEGLLKSIPFAIWFFLAIEGVATVSEEVKNPGVNIPKGYLYGMVTLILVAFGVMITTAGVGNWKSLSAIDYPLPEAIAMALGRDNKLTSLFTSLGLFGLIASFHGIVITYSRQIYALARDGFLPKFLGQVNERFQTPHWSLIIGGVVGMIAILSGTTDKLIILSVMGALTMYGISMVSLFKLRKDKPFLHRPVVTPFYPWFPIIALLCSVVCLGGIIMYNEIMTVVFLSGMILMLIVYRAFKKHTTDDQEDSLWAEEENE